MKIKIAVCLLVFCVLLTVMVIPVSALSWDGSSSGGGGGGSPGTVGGYAVRTSDINNLCVGYRFSVVNNSGSIKAGPIDVFRNTTHGNAAITNNSTFTQKLNKRQLINGQNNGYSTSRSTTNCLYESGMSFPSALPAPSGIETWQSNVNNLNRVFSWLGVGNANNLNFGDKLIVEPLWDVKLRHVYHSLTTTEISIYGKWLLGANSDGGSSNSTDSWGFISRFTNRELPNALFTPNGQGLWPGVSAIGSSSRATFHTIINNGYGAGIAYNETRPDFTPSLSVNSCQAWRGAINTQTFRYGTSTGSVFGNFTYDNGYPIMNDQIWFRINFPAESQAITVRQYVRLQGTTAWTTRDVTLSSSNTTSQWFPFAPPTTTIGSGTTGYSIEARTDHMNGNTVIRTGTVRTFFVPVRPRINRTHVTVRDWPGSLIAENGTNGQYGTLYVGQKVNLRYTWTSSSTWTSTNNIAVNLNGANDFTLMSATINSNSSLERNSSHSPYVVPNVTSLPIELVSSWASDASRTRETTSRPIPVIRADVELREIRLIDVASNTYVSGTTLTPGQRVIPQYVWRNNTNLRVYVEGYDNDQTRIGGGTAFYTLNANGETQVNGKQLTVPTGVTTFSVWGGVYLDGAGRGNTSWETNGSNNARTVTFNVITPSLTVNSVEAWRGSLNTQTFRYGTSTGSAFSNFTYASGYPVMNDQIWFRVNFPAESQPITVRQYVRLQGTTTWTTRDVTLSSTNTTSQWFPFAPSPAVIGSGTSGYTIEARTDHMNGNTVLRTGATRTFYIPVRPRINRHQVTVNDVTNTRTTAQNGANGQSGAVYVGQRVFVRYTYTSSNTWASSNTFSANLNGASDFSVSTTINNSAAYERNSSQNIYRVPNLTSLPITMTTHWNSDPARTSETTSVPVPVIRADAEMKAIRLIDVDSNTYITGTTLTQGQRIRPQYVMGNNSSVRIFVDGYDDGRVRLGEDRFVYSIPPGGEILLSGNHLTVPDDATTFSVWGGVYLDGAGIGNTSWESNENNNEKTVTFTVVADDGDDLAIKAITPNSLYREDTEVITSFRLQNPSSTVYPTANSVSVRFTALNVNTPLYTTTRTGVVIPANGDNLVYFKWTVPSGLNGASVTLRGEVIFGGAVVDTQTLTHGTEKRPVSQTPDTKFEEKRPAWFSAETPPERIGTQSAQWSEWVYENDVFVRRTYGLNLANSPAAQIIPDINSPSARNSSGWIMASGYGFTADWTVPVETLSGTLAPPADAFTNAQFAMMYFPEFMWRMNVNEFRVLDRTAVNRFQLPANPNAKGSARLHFTPLWFPDGTYRAQTYAGDVWTPAGMLSRYYDSSAIQIQGSAYDDWYITR